MEQARKNLKMASILVFIFAGWDFITAIVECLFLDSSRVAELAKTTENIVAISKIVFLVLAVLVLLPQLFVGFRGLQYAKNPKSAKGHIVWAKIIFVILVLAFISHIINLVKIQAYGVGVVELFSTFAEGILYFDYIKYAIAVSKEA